MATAIRDHELAQVIAERKRLGQDRNDEVWEGVYTMAAAPTTSHSTIVSNICGFLQSVIEHPGLGKVHIGINVTDRSDDWEKNFRVPDLSVLLKGGLAVDHDTFVLGGPDFVLEVCSPNENPHEKIPFYESIGVRELLVINRYPWKLELFQLVKGKLDLASKAAPNDGIVKCSAIPFEFELVPGSVRPSVLMRNPKSGEVRQI